MAKTSFRLPEETSQALAQIADQCHNGNRTAALVEAVQRYQQAVLGSVQFLGWVSVRVNGKYQCAKCHVTSDGQAPGFVRLESNGRIGGGLHCGKCAK